ncbi:hypothetical protein NDU88_001783 [Pleurodeles waltl]|uniref:Uncharacterized protein n=1 Tax=Pleurodeles waltl TaxID=8319 RepID=A0AAV7MKP3_PLEWA|nr:hypothetical protein NDU88_001783 [Pleurodeles waltl]
MHGNPPQTLFRVPCHLVGRRAKPRTGAPTPGPAGAPEPKLAEEASPGPVDSQAWANQGTAGWRKGATVPGPARGSLNMAMQGSPPWTPSKVPCPTVDGWMKPRTGAPTLGPSRTLAQGPAGAPKLKPKGEDSPGQVDSQAWPLRVRKTGGSVCPPQGPPGARDPVMAL